MQLVRALKRLAVIKGMVRLAKLKAVARPTHREQVFTSNITLAESTLQTKFERLDVFAGTIENALHRGLEIMYKQAVTKMKNGQVVLSSSGNGELQKKMRDFIKGLQRKMKEKLTSESTINGLFEPMRKQGLSTVNQNTKELELAEAFVDEGQFNSFRRGYRSNVGGVIANDPRRWLESVDANFGQEVARGLAIKQIGTLSINRNVYKLSTITHPRAAYKNILFENYNKQGFTQYKMVAPVVVAKKLSPFGKTAALLYLIKTVGEWNKDATDDKNANTVSGLGLHHGSQEYYYPIVGEQLEDEKAASAEQRRKLKDTLKNS